ncbi:hypothetical protein WR25_25415 [Diploscapter pachys]|uniref:Uncharacterized protein n=1 Tax=Diploscapter pachys TaxID=2018661 RepID=A0A2A2JGF1_9BILA|nr:hypothetical protein WR25_25415 [Diploscapter pachys]
MHLSPQTRALLVVILGLASAFFLLLFCTLCFVFFRQKRRTTKWATTTMIPTKLDESACSNAAFDFEDEFSPRRIEERRQARQMALQSIDPSGSLSLNRIDPAVGRALAVEQLLSGSCLIDAKTMNPNDSYVKIIAAKRDYL